MRCLRHLSHPVLGNGHRPPADDIPPARRHAHTSCASPRRTRTGLHGHTRLDGAATTSRCSRDARCHAVACWRQAPSQRGARHPPWLPAIRRACMPGAISLSYIPPAHHGTIHLRHTHTPPGHHPLRQACAQVGLPPKAPRVHDSIHSCLLRSRVFPLQKPTRSWTSTSKQQKRNMHKGPCIARTTIALSHLPRKRPSAPGMLVHHRPFPLHHLRDTIFGWASAQPGICHFPLRRSTLLPDP
jgi:hypothetical protein